MPRSAQRQVKVSDALRSSVHGAELALDTATQLLWSAQVDAEDFGIPSYARDFQDLHRRVTELAIECRNLRRSM